MANALRLEFEELDNKSNFIEMLMMVGAYPSVVLPHHEITRVVFTYNIDRTDLSSLSIDPSLKLALIDVLLDCKVNFPLLKQIKAQVFGGVNLRYLKKKLLSEM